MAGSGWCHHPLRKTTNELLIMVRRNELACRDQWSHSLWEEGTWKPAPADARRDAASIEVGHPLLPASEGDIAALLRAERAERPAVFAPSQEDVVLGEARLVSNRTPPWRHDDHLAEPRHDYDPRTAIKKAREAYRERMRAQEAARAALVDEAPLAVDAAEPAAMLLDVAGEPDSADDHANLDAGTGLDAGNVSTIDEPHSVEEVPEFADEREHATEALGADESAVAGGLVIGHVVDAMATDWWAAGDAGPDAPFAEWAEPDADEAAAQHAPADEPVAVPEPAGVSRAWSPDWFVDEAAPPVSGVVASSPWSVASAATSDASTPLGLDANEDDWQDDAASGLDETHTASAPDWEWGEVGPIDEHGHDAWRAEGDGEDAGAYPAAVEEQAFEDIVVETLQERVVIPLLPVGSVAPGVPRICRTCRDFRPAEGGDRGWCANQWAFTTRQMVYPEDPAPCETSAGSWWLPTDDLCLADADVSTHGQPTPHLDKWLPHHRERVAERKRS